MFKFIKKIGNRGKLKEIRYSYFLIMVIGSTIPLIILGVISLNISKNTIANHQINTTESHLETYSQTTDLIFTNIINLQRIITWNSTIQNELKKSTLVDKDSELLLDQNTVKKLEKLINSYFIDTQNISSICLFDVNQRSVCYGNTNSMGMYDKPGVYKYMQHNDWFKLTTEAKGRSMFFSHNVLNTLSENTFSSTKLILNSSNVFEQEILGMLVVNIDKAIFNRMFKKRGANSITIYDEMGGQIDQVYKQPKPFDYKEVQAENLKEKLIGTEQNGYLVSSIKNETTGWTIVNMIKNDDLYASSSYIRWVTAIISFIMVVLSFFISFVASGKMTKPVINLKNMISIWNDDFKKVDVPRKKNEIEMIGETFKKVTSENEKLNSRLIESKLKAREAELQVLQAQIKPHFLYNTLDSLYWMATLQKNNDIAKMVLALSESFKISLSNGKDFIFVEEELTHIKHFLTIQNLRYKDKFQYIEKVEESLLHKKILKLLLQPIIENAIYHGLEQKIGSGTVILTGRLEEDYVVFTIEDDGVGISNLHSIKPGFGLNNVEERLLLYYGPDSSLTIKSEKDIGTIIEIRYKDRLEDDLDA